MRLPLKLVVKPVLPVKNANFKITLDTNKSPVNLNDVFPGESAIALLDSVDESVTVRLNVKLPFSDLLGENSGAQGNALGFQIFGGPVVTVLASKTSRKF